MSGLVLHFGDIIGGLVFSTIDFGDIIGGLVWNGYSTMPEMKPYTVLFAKWQYFSCDFIF